MKIFKNTNITKNYKRAALAIGNFDGVHRGHQKIFKETRRIIKKSKVKLGVLTFTPLPVMFFNSKIKNYRLASENQKIDFLKKNKVDFVINIKFNKKFSKINAEQFIKKIIYKKLNVKFLAVSNNFKFGKNRKGNTQTLKYYENVYNYKTIITNPLLNLKKTISSSLIRKKISLSKINEANKLLNRNWCVEGKVVKGKKRGRKIGFPTCNINLNDYIVPRLGVYSVIAETNSFRKKGIANVGYRPTFNGQNLLLEVNIFGINKNLYNKEIEVNFIKFIRSEKKFKGLEELKKQIKIDIIQAKKNV